MSNYTDPGAFVRPAGSPWPMKIYLAGKISRNDWRQELLPDLPNMGPGGPSGATPTRWKGYEQDLLGYNCFLPYGHYYCGPFFEDLGGHGLAHGAASHGVGLNYYPREKDQLGTFHACCRAIDKCDVFFAWIDREDIYGTLFELGYAHAMSLSENGGEPIRKIAIAIATPYGSPFGRLLPRSHDDYCQDGESGCGDEPNELWFALTSAHIRFEAPDPITAVHMLLRGFEHAKNKPSYPAVQGTARDLEPSRVPRKGLHPSIRWFIIQKADYTCTYCKRRHHSSSIGPDNQPWHLDHAMPLARGGRDEPENLVLSCARCNQKKGTQHPSGFRP